MKLRPLPVLFCLLGATAAIIGGGVFFHQREVSAHAAAQSANETSDKPVQPVTRFLNSPPPENERRFGAEASSRRQAAHLEREIHLLSKRWERLRNLAGEELIAAVLEMNLSDIVTKIYPDYQVERAQLESASQSGFGPHHPKILALKVSSDTKYSQLLSASESAKSNLETQLNAAQIMLTEEKVKIGSTSGAKGKHGEAENKNARHSPVKVPHEDDSL